MKMNTAEKLQAIIDACKCDVILSVRENTASYQSVEEYFDILEPGWRDEDEKSEIEYCIEAGVICKIQAYQRTPVGFVVTYAPTMELVIDQMYEGLGLK
jgi:hypothetical protein